VGSIETGKQADLVMFDVPDYRDVPYYFGVNLVVLTMKNGKVLCQKDDMTWEDD
jgi:imidazolonepropionase